MQNWKRGHLFFSLLPQVPATACLSIGTTVLTGFDQNCSEPHPRPFGQITVCPSR